MRCANHPEVPASHRCDDCARLWCVDCLDQGHRLLTCPDCGELALPIERSAARTTREVERQRVRERPYTLVDALVYVFRGRGLWIFGSYLGLLVVLALISIFPVIGSFACLATIILVGAVLILVPGALFSIVRSTAKGDDELPDWPDFSEFGERLGEIFDFVVLGLVSALPLVGLVKLAGCDGWGRFTGECWPVIILGWLLSMVIWVPAFGAVALFQEGWLTIRLDLHLRAVFQGGVELLGTALLVTVLVVAVPTRTSTFACRRTARSTSAASVPISGLPACVASSSCRPLAAMSIPSRLAMTFRRSRSAVT